MVGRAAWFRIFLSVLTLQPTFAQAASGTQTIYVVDLTWSQVQRLAPGTEIMIRKPGVALLRQRVLGVDGDEVKTFAVSDMAVQFAKQLRKAAATNPDYLLQPRPPETTIALGNHVSLRDSGVFVREKRVAEIQEFVLTISRNEIDSGSATVSTVPVRNQLPLSAQILVGAGIGLVALAIIIAHLVPYT